MCGFAGYWTQSSGTGGKGDQAPEILGRMNSAIRHRGPDDDGCWTDGEAGIALGFRRLSILDLSPLGHQPMSSGSGRYVVAFNGEIYNFAEIREELESRGHSFRGHSDTEILLGAVEQFGIVDAVKQCAGMFAIALWDRAERTLYLVRDRLGEKPLYYGWAGGTLLFGSELKALRQHPAWQGEIDPDVLALFLRHNYIPAPYSIYKGIRKVVPGTIVSFGPGSPGAEPQQTVYWSAAAVVERSLADPFQGTESEAADELEALLRRVIRDEMVSDVPLGAFLSGGIDSSAVVALMQQVSDRPVRTFTIGFNETNYNEAEHAKAVAKHLGTDHTELYVTPKDAMDVIPLLPRMFDEPFADSSQIPTYLVAKMAREHVTVCLSGDGGDELFGGYERYFVAEQVWQRSRRMPAPLRSVVATGLNSVSAKQWNRLFDTVGPVLPFKRVAFAGEKLHRLARLLGPESHQAMYRDLLSLWVAPEEVMLGGREPATVLTVNGETSGPPLQDRMHRMMYLDLVSYLPGDILTKVDRASMATSLESRAPFMDHRVVALAWRLPLEYKVRQGMGKVILRNVLYRHVPHAMIERPKMGFGVPVGSWIKGPLREWADELLAPARLRAEGHFNERIVRRTWDQHLDGSHDWHYRLWPILMFQAWLAEA